MKRTSPLIAAIKHGDIVAAKRLIDVGANLDEEDVQGWTPLFHAAHRGDANAVRLLVKSGADVNHGVHNGFTALFSAVLGGHREVVSELLLSGAKTAPVQGLELQFHTTSEEIRALLRSASSQTSS